MTNTYKMTFDGHKSILQLDDGPKYVIDPTLEYVMEGGPAFWSRVVHKTCQCCGHHTRSEPYGPRAYDLDELIAKGWAVAEDEDDQWRMNRMGSD